MDSRFINEMVKNQIDPELTENILKLVNSPDFKNNVPLKVKGIPAFNGKTIVDISGSIKWEGDIDHAAANLRNLTDTVKIPVKKNSGNGKIILGRKELEEIGLHLLPLTALGILNGGSATSYVDRIKNNSFNRPLFKCSKDLFDNFSDKYKSYPKGLTPAYINRDYSDGYSFSELKMRSILLKIKKYKTLIGEADFRHSLFQMTSCSNNSQIEQGFKKYSGSSILKKLIDETDTDITDVLTGIQPMIPAFTHSSSGRTKKIFTCAYGEEGKMLPLPGGHGQNFQVLKAVYKRLYEEGKRFIYLGNVDNIGFNIDPAEVAVLALSGKQAAFDFSFKTSVDVKGGILVYDENDRINCADIGPAISMGDVEKEEKEGKAILFNCATGLFNLEYLTDNIDKIISNLPLRISDQEKDAGLYSQAEQTTWEVIGLLDDFIIFGVDKYKRFLASKLLMENFLISRPESLISFFDNNPQDPMNSVSVKMNKGLDNILKEEMELTYTGQKWIQP
ncbi:MAG TPA: hypothetical protein DCY00_03400 [Actinobacteria bacterium]|nr:hypothetical protein [Actinomycetota bacterium]